MNTYRRVIEALRAKNEIAFIPFAVAGDPDIETSELILKTYIDNGADILEIGYPFSDPIADGPTNQKGANRALAAGFTPAKFFALIKKIRQYSDIPIGLLLYTNTMLKYGFDAFCKKASQSGVTSILIADMPPEEAEHYEQAMAANNLETVYIVTELTPPERMRNICKKVNGFVYVVSRLGVTGVQQKLSTSAGTTLASLRSLTTQPLCVGFGLSSPAHIAGIKKAGADGAIVGSALVSMVEKGLDNKAALIASIGKKIRAYKKATK